MLSLAPLRVARAQRHFSTGERPMVRLAKSIFRDRRRRKVGTDFPVQPGRVSPPRPVPGHIRKPHYVDSEAAAPTNDTCLHDADGIAGMRESCRRAAEILEYAGQLVGPGVTTDEIDRILHERCMSLGLYPSPLHYSGFPKSVCTSVNEVVCHGIPDSRPLSDGDIINVDVTVFTEQGYHGDTSRTFCVGEVDEGGRELVAATEESMYAGIAAAGPGARLSAIGRAIADVADQHRFGLVRSFAGHGIGQVFHAAPLVKHYRNNDDTELVPGMTITVEPMLVEGSEKLHLWSDKWTAVTVDGGRCAQAEHTVLITEDGPEILTQV